MDQRYLTKFVKVSIVAKNTRSNNKKPQITKKWKKKDKRSCWIITKKIFWQWETYCMQVLKTWVVSFETEAFCCPGCELIARMKGSSTTKIMWYMFFPCWNAKILIFRQNFPFLCKSNCVFAPENRGKTKSEDKLKLRLTKTLYHKILEVGDLLLLLSIILGKKETEYWCFLNLDWLVFLCYRHGER